MPEGAEPRSASSRRTCVADLLLQRAWLRMGRGVSRAIEIVWSSMVAKRKTKPKRDIEKDYPPKRFAAKLRRLADCIEQGKRFRIQVRGERVSIPPDAVISIEHERGESDEEVEFQLKWTLDG